MGEPQVNSYIQGEVAVVSTLPNGFVDQTTGASADPTVVTLTVGIIGEPSTWVTYTYGVGEEIVKDSVGNYHADLNTTGWDLGNWTYVWQGTGAVISINSWYFTVTAAPLGT